jgi:hypothetical protein
MVVSTETSAAVILGDAAHEAGQPPLNSSRVTIDEVLRCVARQRPDALALIDTEDRERFTDRKPQRLSYAEADRIVAGIAQRLRGMGLPTDAVIGIQLPNIVENILTILGVMRAEMIAAPLPLLWRRAEAVEALGRVGAKALITCGHVGSFNYADFALYLAAEVFSVRYVCAFGRNLPDGVVPFDDLMVPAASDPAAPYDWERQGNAALHIAAVTFDTGEGGIVPVARTHSELFAGGLATLLETLLPSEVNIISALAPASFAGISLTLLPWLLSGGTLALHHAFDPDVLTRQRADYRCCAIVVPGAAAFALPETGILAGEERISVIAAWRSPEQLAASPAWLDANSAFVDVSIFGETAIVPRRRGPNGKPSPILLGRLSVPRETMDGLVVGELARTESGTLAVRGPIVPNYSFPPGIEHSSLPHFKVGSEGLVDTGYCCHVDSATQEIVVSSSPTGIASVGGYRFRLRHLQEAVGRIGDGATLAALPDPLIGQQLIGNAADRTAMQTALQAAGANPIVVAAFRDRSEHHLTET